MNKSTGSNQNLSCDKMKHRFLYNAFKYRCLYSNSLDDEIQIYDIIKSILVIDSNEWSKNQFLHYW